MKCDLHIHSAYSDGADEPERIIDLASTSRLDCISFTEHDSLFGVKLCGSEMNLFASIRGIDIIRGAEFSTRDPETDLKTHILAYWPEYGSFSFSHINPMIEQTRMMRNRIAVLQIEHLRTKGLDINIDDILKRTKEGQIFKSHLFEAVSQLSKNQKEAQSFFSLFKRGQCCHFQKEYPKTQDIIQAIIKDGGYPVLAHPVYSRNFEQVGRYAHMGLKGIEYVHPTHTKSDMCMIKNIARRFELVLTGGSDYHGSSYREGKLGRYYIEESASEGFLLAIDCQPM